MYCLWRDDFEHVWFQEDDTIIMLTQDDLAQIENLEMSTSVTLFLSPHNLNCEKDWSTT